MSQSRRGSALEAVTNVVVGFGINFTANAALFPLFGWAISVEQNLTLGAAYTAISLLRGYVLRRCFNRAAVRSANAKDAERG